MASLCLLDPKLKLNFQPLAKVGRYRELLLESRDEALAHIPGCRQFAVYVGEQFRHPPRARGRIAWRELGIPLLWHCANGVQDDFLVVLLFTRDPAAKADEPAGEKGCDQEINWTVHSTILRYGKSRRELKCDRTEPFRR